MAVNDLITFRKGISSEWISANPVLASGEPGYDLTNSILKIGDGVSNWVALSGIGSTSVGGGGSSSTSVIEYGAVSNFPASGVGSTIYISTDTGRIYRWASSVYQELGPVSYAPIGSDSRWDLFLPPAPTGLAVTAGNTQVLLSWSAPTVSIQTPITDYTIQYSANSGSSWTTFTRSASTSTTVYVTGLTNGQAYVFRVAAVNGIGTGAYSTASSVVTPVAFSPSSIGGLQAWYDASDASTLYDATSGGSLVAADGGIARWQDSSGMSFHVTQSSSGSRPILKSAQINGLSAVEFNGSSHFLSTVETITGSQSRTVFAVAKRTNNNSFGTVARFGPDRSVTSTNLWLCRYGTTGNPHVGGDSTVTNQDLSAGVQAAWTNAHVSCWSQNASNRNLTYLLNGSSLSIVGNPPQAQTNFAGMSIGVFSSSAGGSAQYFSGLIGELIVYNQELNSTDRQSVTSYLMTKWGIA